MKLTDFSPHQNLCVLAVGHPGSGKTGALASLAIRNRVDVFDFDRRIKGIFGCTHLPLDKITENMVIEQPDSYADFKPFLEKYQQANLLGTLPRYITLESISTMMQIYARESARLKGGKGNQTRGAVTFLAPDDHKFAVNAVRAIFTEFFRNLNCSVILSGWLTEMWAPDPTNPYGPQKVVGERIFTSNNTGSEIAGYFDEIWRFYKKTSILGTQFFVDFDSGVAKTAIPQLRGRNEVDITGISFADKLAELLKG